MIQNELCDINLELFIESIEFLKNKYNIIVESQTNVISEDFE